MFGRIIYINDTLAHIEIPEGTPVAENLMNMHVVFEDNNKKIVGEVEDIDQKIVRIRFLGEIVNKKFVGGVIRKPTLQSKLRIINKEELNEKFIKEAKAQGLINLKGHRLVGGMRASLYNAMPIEGVKSLVAFMKKFEEENL